MTSRAEGGVKTTGLQTSSASRPSLDVGAYKADKNFRSLHRVHSIYFKGTGSETNSANLQVKNGFLTSTWWLYLAQQCFSCKSSYLQTQRQCRPKQLVIFIPGAFTLGSPLPHTKYLHQCRRPGKSPAWHFSSAPLSSPVSQSRPNGLVED